MKHPEYSNRVILPSLWSDREFVFLISASVLALLAETLDWFRIVPKTPIAGIIAAIFSIVIGREVLTKGLKSLLHMRFGSISLLVTVSVIGAFVLREYTEAAVVISLFALGEKLEDFGIDSSKAALKALAERAPKQIEILNGGMVPLEMVAAGAVIVVKAGSVMGLDGTVVKGNAIADESSLTGESLPRGKVPGDKVFSGTVLTNGYLEVKVEKAAKDSTMARIVEMTAKAVSEKADFQRFLERFAKFYTPIMMGGALLIFLIPVLFFDGDWHKWLLQALTLLIISCPCALVVSTPISIFAAVGNAASHGALIKGGRYLEALSKVDTVVMDKTRTITIGKPAVTDVISFGPMSPDEVLACAAGIESLSEHPLAVAIVEEAKRKNLKLHEADQYKTILGKGAEADCYVCQDKHHFIGSRSLAVSQLTLDVSVESALATFGSQGKTVVLMWTAKGIEGALALQDSLKPEAVSSLNALRKMGLEPIMLTGDAIEPAREVARLVGISEFYAGLLPENKAEKIQEFSRKGRNVAMVGDGINDAPALAFANVGIAMGAAGSDVAIETAHIALMNDRLDILPYLVGLARKTWKTIRFNTYSAVAVKTAALIMAATGHSSLSLAIMSDVGLLIFVVFFSLQLFKWRSPDLELTSLQLPRNS